MDGNTSKKRRRVLKTIAAGGVSLSAVSTVSATQGKGRYEGLAYDPVTHKVYGNASAQFDQVHEDLRGNLRIGDEQINMNKADLIDSGKAKGMVRSKHGFSEQNASGRTNRYVRLKAVEDGLTGYVEDNGEKVAFSLIPKSRDYDLRWLLDQTAPVKNGKVTPVEGGK